MGHALLTDINRAFEDKGFEWAIMNANPLRKALFHKVVNRFNHRYLQQIQYRWIDMSWTESPVILAKHECTLRELKLTTRVRPLIVSNVRVLLVDFPALKEVLLGQSFLKSLGIDVKDQLEKLALAQRPNMDEEMSDSDSIKDGAAKDTYYDDDADQLLVHASLDKLLAQTKDQGITDAQFH